MANATPSKILRGGSPKNFMRLAGIVRGAARDLSTRKGFQSEKSISETRGRVLKTLPKIPRAFFQRDPITCARELIGCELVWDECAGIIVETEAYSENNDEACHMFMRPSVRAFVAANRPGTAYVYLNYGMYWMLNVLVKGGGEDGFVLIRALQPTRGIELMTQRRNQRARKSRLENPKHLCSGPGKLSQALGIVGKDHGIDLCSNPQRGFRRALNKIEVIADVRIGISKAAHLPWRFLLKESPYVSVPPKVAIK